MFDFNNKSNTIIIFIILALILFFTRSGDYLQTLYSTLLSLPGLIIALSFHEFAHAWMAVKLGDPTPKLQGRLNVNPLSHMDPAGTICLLFAGFGWGKPVQINPTNFKNPEKDSAKVALAGPLMNILLAFISAIIYAIFIVIAVKTGKFTYNANGYIEYSKVWGVLINVMQYSMALNLGLAIFNLLPFPPLDGSKIFRAILKGKAREFLYSLEKYSMIIIMILFITRATSYIITPIIEAIYNYVLVPIIMWIINLAL